MQSLGLSVEKGAKVRGDISALLPTHGLLQGSHVWSHQHRKGIWPWKSHIRMACHGPCWSWKHSAPRWAVVRTSHGSLHMHLERSLLQAHKSDLQTAAA